MPVASATHLPQIPRTAHRAASKSILRCTRCREVVQSCAESCRICGGVVLPVTTTSGLQHAAVIVFNPGVSREDVLTAIRRLSGVMRSRITKINGDFGSPVILLD